MSDFDVMTRLIVLDIIDNVSRLLLFVYIMIARLFVHDMSSSFMEHMMWLIV